MILPFPNRLPVPLGHIRSNLTSKMFRALALGLPIPLVAETILEFALELHLLHYPTRVLRAVLHSLPAIPPAQLARKVYLQWQHSLKEMTGRHRNRNASGQAGAYPPLQGGHPYGIHGGTGPELPPSRRSRHRRRRGSSSNSSNSSEKRKKKQVTKASKVLEAHDPMFRAFKAEQLQANEQEQLRKQSSILAQALKSSFDESLRGALAASAPQQQQQQQQQLPQPREHHWWQQMAQQQAMYPQPNLHMAAHVPSTADQGTPCTAHGLPFPAQGLPLATSLPCFIPGMQLGAQGQAFASQSIPGAAQGLQGAAQGLPYVQGSPCAAQGLQLQGAAQGLPGAAQGLHSTLPGLSMIAPQALQHAAQGLLCAAQGLPSTTQGLPSEAQDPRGAAQGLQSATSAAQGLQSAASAPQGLPVAAQDSSGAAASHPSAAQGLLPPAQGLPSASHSSAAQGLLTAAQGLPSASHSSAAQGLLTAAQGLPSGMAGEQFASAAGAVQTGAIERSCHGSALPIG
eukprot:2268507-Amphidinium_carterae.2